MTFRHVRLPTAVALAFTSGPEFSTEVIVLEGGHEFRNANRPDARMVAQAGYTGKDAETTRELVAFFRARGGQRDGFLFKDHVDFDATSDEGFFAVADGSPSGWQLWKRYTDEGGFTSTRKILKPLSTIVIRQGSQILIDGVDYLLDTTTGVFYPLGSPLPVPTSWAGGFDTAVRFSSDRMEITVIEPGVFTWGNVGLIELLEPR